MIIWLIAFILFLYSEIKAVLVARDQDFRKKLIEDVSPAPLLSDLLSRADGEPVGKNLQGRSIINSVAHPPGSEAQGREKT